MNILARLVDMQLEIEPVGVRGTPDNKANAVAVGPGAGRSDAPRLNAAW